MLLNSLDIPEPVDLLKVGSISATARSKNRKNTCPTCTTQQPPAQSWTTDNRESWRFVSP
jgi:hypothetical protein